ncbi:MAG: hypothetical protein U9O64_10845 [Campylobacterota bacterium]|nr:hypothetical protein [Campylobacterota bacterium]
MIFLENYTVRRYIMGFLLMVIICFGTYAAFADMLKSELGGKSEGIWIEMASYAGYVALGAILIYIPLSIFNNRLYEKALKESKEKGDE